MTNLPLPAPETHAFAQFESVRDIVRRKGAVIHSIQPDATVYEAIAEMEAKRVGALIVMEAGAVVGLISERDYARKIALKGRNSRETAVREVMSSPVITVTPSHTATDCMKIVTERRVRHLPVMEDGRLTGVVSIGDLIHSMIASLSDTVRDLNSYITGGYPH